MHVFRAEDINMVGMVFVGRLGPTALAARTSLKRSLWLSSMAIATFLVLLCPLSLPLVLMFAPKFHLCHGNDGNFISNRCPHISAAAVADAASTLPLVKQNGLAEVDQARKQEGRAAYEKLEKEYQESDKRHKACWDFVLSQINELDMTKCGSMGEATRELIALARVKCLYLRTRRGFPTESDGCFLNVERVDQVWLEKLVVDDEGAQSDERDCENAGWCNNVLDGDDALMGTQKKDEIVSDGASSSSSSYDRPPCEGDSCVGPGGKGTPVVENPCLELRSLTLGESSKLITDNTYDGALELFGRCESLKHSVVNNCQMHGIMDPPTLALVREQVSHIGKNYLPLKDTYMSLSLLYVCFCRLDLNIYRYIYIYIYIFRFVYIYIYICTHTCLTCLHVYVLYILTCVLLGGHVASLFHVILVLSPRLSLGLKGRVGFRPSLRLADNDNYGRFGCIYVGSDWSVVLLRLVICSEDITHTFCFCSSSASSMLPSFFYSV